MAPECLAIAMLFLATILVLENLPGISAYCHTSQLPPILLKCHMFIKKGGPKLQPSKPCCDAFKGVDVPCMCDEYINPSVERVISVEKAIFVAQTCGCTVPPPGAKCGSYVVPPLGHSPWH